MFFATVSSDGSVGDRFINELVPQNSPGFYELPIWTQGDRANFARSVFTLYTTAYELNEGYDASITAKVEKAITDRGDGGAAIMRSFAKDYVAALDSTYRPVGS